MSNAANQMNPLQQTLRQASGCQGRIGSDEWLVTLTETPRELPKVDGKSRPLHPLAMAPHRPAAAATYLLGLAGLAGGGGGACFAAYRSSKNCRQGFMAFLAASVAASWKPDFLAPEPLRA